MLHNKTRFSGAAAAFLLATQLHAGGFWLVLGNPDASPAARNVNAVLTLKLTGCGEPEKASVTATATGIVKGQRQVIPLKLTNLNEPGMYGLTRQWPAEGRWVLEIVGSSEGRFTSALVSAGADGIDRAHARFAMSRPSADDVDVFLRSAGETQASSRR